ncbi:Nn.00g012430.m01.CDS01 [Neocucurbitaria sp. VM-36]
MSDHDRNDSRESTLETTSTVRDSIPSPGLTTLNVEKVPTGLARPCRPKPHTSECLDKDFVEVDGMCFQTTTEATTAMNHALWQPLANDASIPVFDEDHRKVAKTLVDAFKDMTIAKDTQGNAYRKRLTKGEAVYYSDWAIEACAWNILAMVKSIHTEGFKAPIYDRAIVDSIGQTQLWTFQERMDWICLVLKTSKNVAVTLMKHEKTWTTIGAPHKLYHSTLVNSVSNANRNTWVKVGREADEAHTSRPRKRQRALKTTKKDASTDSTATSLDDLSNESSNGTIAPNDKIIGNTAEALPAALIKSKPSPEQGSVDSASSSSSAIVTASPSTPAPAAQQAVADVEMMDIDSEQLVEKKPNDGDDEGRRRVGDIERQLPDVSGITSQANVTALPSMNNVCMHDAQTMETAYLLAALHTAR